METSKSFLHRVLAGTKWGYSWRVVFFKARIYFYIKIFERLLKGPVRMSLIWYWGNAGLVKMTWKVFSSLLFGGWVWEGLVLVLWMYSRIQKWNFLLLDFNSKIFDVISLPVIGLRFSRFPWFSLGRLSLYKFIHLLLVV